jgi:hypothetical protein
MARRRLPKLLAAAIIGLGVAGGLYQVRRIFPLAGFDLDGEWTLPTLFSAGLLFANAAVLISMRDVVSSRLLAWSVAVLLVLAGVDEVVQIHERLEEYLRVDWQVIYLPAIAVGGLLCVLLLRQLWSSREARLFFAIGITAWATSQILEYAQWNGDRQVNGYSLLMVTEELMEMTGSALLLLALLSFWRDSWAGRAEWSS